MGPNPPATMRSRTAPRFEGRGDYCACLAPAQDLDRKAMVAEGECVRRQKPCSGTLEGDDLSVLELNLYVD